MYLPFLIITNLLNYSLEIQLTILHHKVEWRLNNSVYYKWFITAFVPGWAAIITLIISHKHSFITPTCSCGRRVRTSL